MTGEALLSVCRRNRAQPRIAPYGVVRHRIAVEFYVSQNWLTDSVPNIPLIGSPQFRCFISAAPVCGQFSAQTARNCPFATHAVPAMCIARTTRSRSLKIRQRRR